MFEVKDVRIGEKFMEMTKFEYLEASGQREGQPPPPLQLPHDEAGQFVDLPPPPGLQSIPVNLPKLIAKRQSLRSFSDAPLSLTELSYLLWCTPRAVSGRISRFLSASSYTSATVHRTQLGV